jgi:single-strand DNA-binding protein
MNQINVIGNLGKDPDCKFTQTGTAVTSFSIAVKSGYGEYKRTDWLDVVTFGKTAEIMGNALHQGSKVLVTGRLQIDKWDGNDGQKHSKPVIYAENIEFLDSKKQQTESSGDNSFDAKSFGKDVFPEEEVPF